MIIMYLFSISSRIIKNKPANICCGLLKNNHKRLEVVLEWCIEKRKKED